MGGCPALIINTEKSQVQNLNQSDIEVPWGCEIVWFSLAPKNVRTDSIIQKIICASIYSKPGSKTKSKLVDHISDTYNLLSTKYRYGLHWILSGDTNELNLSPIINLDSNKKQMVQDRTHLWSKPPGIKDPILTTLSKYYQKPICLPPLKSDDHLSESDHLMPFMEPVNTLNNNPARQKRHIKLRRLPESQLKKLEANLANYDWSKFYKLDSAHQKAEVFQNIIF